MARLIRDYRGLDVRLTDEARRRAYISLALHRGATTTPYVLRGRQGQFLQFARRLQAFHADRNRYRYIRSSPAGPLFAATRDSAQFLGRVAKLMMAVDMFEKAQEEHADSGEMQLIQLTMAVEALFSDDDKNELSYRLAHRMAALNGASVEQRKQQAELVRSMYEARSKLMHGAAFIQKPSKRLRELVGDAGFIEVPADPLLAFNNLVRGSILYFIALRGPDFGREDVLKLLDDAIWDASEVVELRRRANEYWGFTGRDDERLCSAHWTIE